MTKTTIPGPSEWPLVGSIGRIIEDPPKFFVELAEEYGEMAQFHLFGQRVVLISSPALIREVLVERVDEFPKSPRDIQLLSPYLGQGLLTNNGSSHRQRRKLVQPAFHHKRVQSYGAITVDYTQDMLATWHDGDVRNINQELVRLTLYIVAKSLFNEDASQMAQLVDAIGHGVRELQDIVDRDFELPWIPPLWLPTPGNRRRLALQSSLRTTIDGIIANRLASAVDGKVEDRGDLLSMLLLSKDEAGEGLSQEEVRDEVITILLAGHETTSNALTWTWYLLAQHPEVAAKLYAEVDHLLAERAPEFADLPKLSYTQKVIKEAMRLYPPAWMLNGRHVYADTTLGGYTLKRGTDIFIAPYVMHRLPRYYEDANEFRPERFTAEFEESLPRFAYMPFGGGPRVCIGNAFAMMEAQLILATVSRRFAPALLPGTVVEKNPQITLSVKGGLTMRLDERYANENKQAGESEQTELVLAS